jgi:hypothetical protein
MNGPDDVLTEMARAIARQRGYADFFDWPDKRQKEFGLLEVFVEAFRKAGQLIRLTLWLCRRLEQRLGLS